MTPRAVSGFTGGLPLKAPITWEAVCKGNGLGMAHDSSSCVVSTALLLRENSALLSCGSTANVFQGDHISIWQQGSDSLAMLSYVCTQSHPEEPQEGLCAHEALLPVPSSTPWRRPLFCPPWSWIESILLLPHLLSQRIPRHTIHFTAWSSAIGQ